MVPHHLPLSVRDEALPVAKSLSVKKKWIITISPKSMTVRFCNIVFTSTLLESGGINQKCSF